MHRREFLLGAVAAACKLTPKTWAYAWTGNHFGVRLASVHRACEQDLPGTLRHVRRYKHVEFAGGKKPGPCAFTLL